MAVSLIHAAILTVFTPLFAGFLAPAIGTFISRKWVNVFACMSSAATLLFAVLTMVYASSGNGILLYRMGGFPPPVGIVLEVDKLNSLIAVASAAIILLATIYSTEYMSREGNLSLYYALLLTLESGMMGALYTGDLFNLFVFLELMSVPSYALVAFLRRSFEAVEAGLKYMFMSALALNFYYFATAFIYGAFGTLNMADLSVKISLHGQSPEPLSGGIRNIPSSITLVLPAIMALTLWSFGLKSALAPLHTWLPDAHPAAPTPISAVLSGAFVKVTVYTSIRLLFTVFHGGVNVIEEVLNAVHSSIQVVTALSMLSMLLGSLAMLLQNDIKRFLAYSTIANIGYAFLGVSLASESGLTASTLHVINHMITKALLFLTVGCIIHKTHIRDIRELGGLYARMPITATCYIIGALSIAGVPPLNVFVSKLLLVIAALEKLTPTAIVGAILLVVTSAIVLAAQFRVIHAVFFGKLPSSLKQVSEPGLPMLAPITILTASTVVLGVYPYPLIELASNGAKAALDYVNYVASAQLLMKP